MLYLENISEEKGKISFVEYTPTGIFILKIKKRKYRGVSIKSEIFRIDDEVNIVFNEKTKEVYAVLNKTNQTLFLNEKFPKIEYYNFKQCIRDIIATTFALFLFFSFAYIFYQYFMDGTLYYIDLTIHLTILFFIFLFGATVYNVFRFSSHGFQQMKPLFDLLELPILTGRILKSIRLINSKFIEFDNIYSLKHINDLKEKMNILTINEKLKSDIHIINHFGLNRLETNKFQIEKISGQLKDTDMKKQAVNKNNPDPLYQIKSRIDVLDVYAESDEFLYHKGSIVQAIISKYADQDGHYIWAMYDGLKRISLDVNITEKVRKKLLLDILDFQKFRYLQEAIYFVSLLILTVLGFIQAFVAIGIMILFYLHFRMCFLLYLKISKPRRPDLYLKDQINHLFLDMTQKELAIKNLTAHFNSHRNVESRTGFIIKR